MLISLISMYFWSTHGGDRSFGADFLKFRYCKWWEYPFDAIRWDSSWVFFGLDNSGPESDGFEGSEFSASKPYISVRCPSSQDDIAVFHQKHLKRGRKWDFDWGLDVSEVWLDPQTHELNNGDDFEPTQVGSLCHSTTVNRDKPPKEMSNLIDSINLVVSSYQSRAGVKNYLLPGKIH